MAEPLRKTKAPAKIVLRRARAKEIRSSLGIGTRDRIHAHAAIVAVKKAAKPAVKAAKMGVLRSAKKSARKSAVAKLRRPAERVKAGGGKI
jgi:hypothetical protein